MPHLSYCGYGEFLCHDNNNHKRAKTQHLLQDCMYSSLDLRYTLQPLYNMVCYNKILDITHFIDGSQKCIVYIEK